MKIKSDLTDALDSAEEIKDPREKKRAILDIAGALTPEAAGTNKEAGTENLNALWRVFTIACSIVDDSERRSTLGELLRLIAPGGATLPLYIEAVTRTTDELTRIPQPIHRKSALLRLAGELPHKVELKEPCRAAMSAAIDASDKIADLTIRRGSLIEIAKKLEEREELDELRLHALKVALGLADVEGYNRYSLELIGGELPKSCDYAFYRDKTFLGITLSLPKRGEFLKLFKEAMEVAIQASLSIEGPYYRKYALLFIAGELSPTGEFLPLYKKAVQGAFEASAAITDGFSRHYALFELFKALPREREFYPLILGCVEKMLPFFSMKSRFEDVEALDILDYIIVAEEKKMKDSKKKRYTRENYAKNLAHELEGMLPLLDDMRFVEVLRPYSHIWVKPVELRDSVKKVIAHIEGLKDTYHGSEITRPVFIKESHPEPPPELKEKLEKAGAPAAFIGETVSMDLGATNTVIMIKEDDSDPEYLDLGGVSTEYGGAVVVPTAFEPESGTIGKDAEAAGAGACAYNMKRLLLMGTPGAFDKMSGYVTALLKLVGSALDARTEGAAKTGKGVKKGWLSFLSSSPSQRLCVTVPVGFGQYRDSIGEILGRATRMELELVEEPLAAAIGYNVTEAIDKLVMVMDFGGCTLDVMLLRLNSEDVHVVAKPDRSNMLGGHDIDLWTAAYLKEKFSIATTPEDPVLLRKAEELKIALSERSMLPFSWKGKELGEVTRGDLEGVLSENGFYKSVDRTISYILKKAGKLGVSKEMVQAVLLTGGSSQIPSFKEKVEETFPELRAENAVYDHSPFSAVAEGAALFGTSAVTDRHLGMAYALRFASRDGRRTHSYEVVLEKGDHLPLEKTFRAAPAKTLGVQSEVFLELFEVPEALVHRRWVSESGMEFIKQVLKPMRKEDDRAEGAEVDGSEVEGADTEAVDLELKGLKVITLSFDTPFKDDKAGEEEPKEAKEKDEGEVEFTLSVDYSGNLKVIYGPDSRVVTTGIRLQ